MCVNVYVCVCNDEDVTIGSFVTVVHYSSVVIEPMHCNQPNNTYLFIGSNTALWQTNGLVCPTMPAHITDKITFDALMLLVEKHQLPHCWSIVVHQVMFVWKLWMFWSYKILMCNVYIFSCDQAALRTLQSVRPSVRPSVCLSVRLLHLFHHVPLIVSSRNFQELLPLTKVMSMQKVKGQGHRGHDPT